jgi:Ni/Co efflux regulator RcnB
MRSLVLAAGVFALTLAPLARAAPAKACENPISVELSQVMRRLDHAERELHAGRTREALADARFVLSATSGRGYPYELVLASPAEEARARRLAGHARDVQALAIVRRDGRIDRRRWVPTSRVSETERRAALDWALETLERAARSGEPLARARLAEALARFEPRREEARAILSELARADVMPDAWGYRVLAELADRRGDTTTRNDAITRCHARAGGDARVVCPSLVAVR